MGAKNMGAIGSKERHWAASLSQTGRAVALVRGILGCGCPDAVFHHYQIQLRTSSGLPIVQIIMGNRLLLQLVDVNKLWEAHPTIRHLVRAGLKERDRRGLHRFRLLIVGDIRHDSGEALMDMASSMDPRAHVHVLPNLHMDWMDPRTLERLKGA
jgi:hypothetical protein